MAVLERQVTVEEFEQFLRLPENADHLFELINGEIAEKMPTEEHGLIASNIVMALGAFARLNRSGRVGVEVRHRRPEDHFNSRMPDVSFTSARRPLVTEGSVPQMPDLAVEIKSPDDTVKEMREKAAYYLANGSRIVWLVYPQKRVVEVYRSDADFELFLEHDLLTGGDLLPGFSLPVADIFVDPLAE